MLSQVVLSANEVSTGLDSLTNYGVLGVLSVILIVGARMLVSREMQRADRLEAEVTRLNTLIQDRHIPVLEASTAAVKDSTEALKDSTDALKASSDLNKEIRDLLIRVTLERDIERRQNRGGDAVS